MKQPVVIDEDLQQIYLSKHYSLLNFTSSYSEGNKLLTIALPLLNIALKLRTLTTEFDVAKLQKVLIRQLEIVENNLHRASYSSDIIASAQYMLCAFIDEFIAATDYGASQEWNKNGLLQHFVGDVNDGKKIFVVIKELLGDPSKNLDVLELCYICLNLGFAGKYRQQKKGASAIQEMLSELYRCISHYRKPQDDSKLVINSENISVGAVAMESAKKSRLFSAWVFWVVGIVLFVGMVVYAGFNLHLNHLLRSVDKVAISFDVDKNTH